MNEIFTNLYNKVLGFFRQTEKEETSAKDVACNRLRVVLMQDRTNLTPELMERMRKELVELLSKYLEMDKEALELNLEQDGDQVALMLSIPVIRAKDEEEIQKALEESEQKQENSSEEAQENSEENECSETNGENEEAEKEDSQATNDDKPDTEAPETDEQNNSETTDEDAKSKKTKS